MSERLTMADIAKACGVSQSTVSLVLSNNPRISEDTRSRVLDAISTSGYRPNIHARGLASDISRVISVVLPAVEGVFTDEYFGELMNGIYGGASEAGFKVLVDVADQKFIRSQEYLNTLLSRRADGMLYMGTTLDDKFLGSLAQPDLKFILVNDYFPEHRLNFVAADRRQAAQLAAKHLIDLGHRHIGLITGTNIQTANDFLSALAEQLAKANLPRENTPWIDGQFQVGSGYDSGKALLEANPHLTAVVCGSDKMAAGLLRYCHSKGIKVPDDLSVVGVDNLRSSVHTSPSMTTIDLKLAFVGRQAARQLLAMIRGEVTVCRELTPVEIVVRQSTGAPRAG